MNLNENRRAGEDTFEVYPRYWILPFLLHSLSMNFKIENFKLGYQEFISYFILIKFLEELSKIKHAKQRYRYFYKHL